MNYETISIREVIKLINEKRMYLPEIQRGYVWKEKQVEKLFESIFVGYPIGSLLFWKTNKRDINSNGLILYDFIKDYHERDDKDNKKASAIASDFPDYFIVLDGQQRLSALFIGLQGSVAYKLPYLWWSSNDAFPQKKLFFNLDSKSLQLDEDDDDEKIPIFKFFEIDKTTPDNNWFLVSDILKFEQLSDIIEYATENNLSKDRINNLSKFWNNINLKNPPIIHYLTIEGANYDDVLNIFVRLNSSGTPLSKPDLLFSTMLLDWNGGREVIEKFIKKINNKGSKFDFTKDFIMRTCLVLSGASVSMKVESFKKEKISYIKNNFFSISKAIEDAVDSLVDLGYSNDNMLSYNALIPYIYYLYRGGSSKGNSVNGLRTYLAISFLKNIYGVASNSALSNTRNAIDKYNCKKFGFDISIFDNVHLVGDREFKVTKDDIDSYMDKEKGLYTFYILTLLYPNLKLGQIKFHQDHVHPYISFDELDSKKLTNEQIEKWKRMRNTLPNLQLLEGSDNESKNRESLTEWVKAGNVVEYSDNKESTDLYNFENYYNARKEKIINKLLKIFSLK
ncbi:MAG TPA: DUF262 domain-containing protein [Bacilli bacterium]|nr:DUF262 domain-containing protein [Bacilli bacterium]HPZ23269.1 DUF262 domain-containing protein [Bacilli bacterium]HQC83286.1 DUF262 domain-containing protein [Bacilli bacterium]